MTAVIVQPTPVGLIASDCGDPAAPAIVSTMLMLHGVLAQLPDVSVPFVVRTPALELMVKCAASVPERDHVLGAHVPVRELLAVPTEALLTPNEKLGVVPVLFETLLIVHPAITLVVGTIPPSGNAASAAVMPIIA